MSLPGPLAQIPLFVAGHGQFGMSARHAHRLMLIGIGFVALLGSINSVHAYVPASEIRAASRSPLFKTP